MLFEVHRFQLLSATQTHWEYNIASDHLELLASISVLWTKCLLDHRRMFKTPSSHNILMSELGPTTSVTFRNQQSNNHTHFTKWLASWENRQGLNVSLKLFFSFLHTYSLYPVCVQSSVTPRMTSKRSCMKVWTLIPVLKFIVSRPQRHTKDTEFLKRV